MTRPAHSLMLCGVAALVMLASCATPEVTPETPAPPVNDYAQLMDDVRILSADDMEGRDTGAPGGERARAYIVARLEAMGIAPASFGRLQPFEATGRTREGPKTFNGT